MANKNIVQVYKPRSANGTTSFMAITLVNGLIESVTDSEHGAHYTIEFQIPAKDFNEFKKRMQRAGLYRESRYGNYRA